MFFKDTCMENAQSNCKEAERGSQDWVRRITLVQPDPHSPHEKVSVLYHRATEEHRNDVDLLFEDVVIRDNRLPVHLYFEGSVELKQGKIVDVDREKSCVEVIHAVDRSMTAAFNKDDESNWKDIRWTFYDNNRTLYWVFPDDWKSELDLKDLKICSTFDFHAVLSLKVMPEDDSADPVEVEIVVDSRPTETTDAYCKAKQLLFQWGRL